MSDEPADDTLLDIALAVADGSDVSWAAVREQAPAGDAAVIDALEAVSRLARRPSSEPDPMALSRWGHLHIIGVSHRGDETRYAARDEALGREVVLTLVGPLHGDAAATEVLLDQARRRTRVTHPNLAEVFGADYSQDRVGYWAEHVDGRSLAEIVASGGRYSVTRACRIVETLCAAVGALHDAGLSNGGVFAAQVVETEPRGVVLSPSMGLRDGALETDIFDLGALLLFLLTGLPARRSDEPAALALRIRQSRPDLQPRVIAVIEQCLAGEPSRAFSSARDLANAIRTASTDAPVTAEWVIGFGVTALVMLLLLWYALSVK